MFEVTVKTLDGKTKVLQIENENLTVSEFKEMISTELEIPIENQRLIFQGKALLNEKKLTEYGVQSKTIHLVSRPPPTADQHATSASEANEESAGGSQNGTQFAPNISWLPIQGIQRAAQNITQGLLLGMSDLGRPSDMIMRSDNAGNMDIHMNLPFLGRRDSQFRRLQRTAVNLLSTIEGGDASNQQTNTSTTPSDEPTQPPTPTPSNTVGEAGIALASENVSIATDSLEASTVDSQPSADNQQNVPSTQNVSLSRLADMLSDQRRLWTQMEPYLDRWENMLRTEQGLQESSTNLNESTATSINATEAAETSINATEAADTLTEITHEPMEATDSTSGSDWSLRYFNKIGRLLHLQSHMLHLLSDFSVSTVRETPATNTPVVLPTTNSTEASAATDLPEMTPSPEVERQSASTRPRRFVTVPERDTPVVHAHINIEPTTVTFARPVNYVSAPINSSIARRSQSAHPATVAQAVNSESNLPTAFIIERPSDVSAESQLVPPTDTDQPNNPTNSTANALNALSREMISFMEMASTPSGTQPTYASNAMTAQPTEVSSTTGGSIQSASTRRVNSAAEANLLQQLSRSLGNLVGANQEGSTASSQLPVGSPVFLPQFQSPSSSSAISADPFLPCHSRHFVNSFRQAHGLRPTIRAPARSVRRGRSAGTNVSDAQQQQQSQTINHNDQPTQPTRPPNMSATVHSVTIPLGSAFSFNGASEHLGNLTSIGDQVQRALAESLGGQGINIFGGPTQQSGGVQSQIAPGNNPLSWVLNFANGAMQAADSSSRPSPTPAETYQELTGETSLSQFPTVIMDGIIHTVWLFIANLARNASTAPPPIDTSDWPSPLLTSSPTTSPFHQAFLRLRENLRTGGFLNSPTTVPEARMHNCVDGLRQPLRQLLPTDFRTFRDDIRDTLTSSLLSNRISDASNDSDPNESAFAEWALNQSTRSAPADLRRSLFNFLTRRMMSQMTLWRESPTNSGFGSLLLLTMHQMGLDLFGFTDLLAKVAAERLGLSLNDGTNNVGGGRSQTFGHSMSLEPLLQHVDAFFSSLPADSDDQRVCTFIRSGLVHCITTYCGLGNHGLSRYIGAPMSLIVFREEREANQSPTASMPDAAAVDMASLSDLHNCQKLKNLQKMENPEDSDSSDVYEDARENPQASSSANMVGNRLTTKAATQNTTNPVHLASPLPQWSLPTGMTLPTVIADALAPNSSFASNWQNRIPDATGDSMPPQWMEIVANDVTHITMNTAVNERDDDELHYRLSDAYIAGMPAKRRRVMLEKKESLLCPVEKMFSNLMTEAIGATTESESLQPSDNTTSPVSGGTGQFYATSAPEAAGVSTPELRGAMKTFITDYLAKRLSSDPDFELTRYPSAKATFAKKFAEK